MGHNGYGVRMSGQAGSGGGIMGRINWKQALIILAALFLAGGITHLILGLIR